MKFRAISNPERKLNVNWDHINVYISRWVAGTPFDVEITRKQSTKSDPLRKYYFSTVLKPFMDELGYDPDEEELFHRQLKIVYFRIKPDEHGIYRNVPSVFGDKSKLPVAMKADFTEWVIRKAAKYGLYIEPAKEV